MINQDNIRLFILLSKQIANDKLQHDIQAWWANPVILGENKTLAISWLRFSITVGPMPTWDPTNLDMYWRTAKWEYLYTEIMLFLDYNPELLYNKLSPTFRAKLLISIQSLFSISFINIYNFMTYYTFIEIHFVLCLTLMRQYLQNEYLLSDTHSIQLVFQLL